MKPKVQVLLSTYNGEKYLETQLDSLFEQEDVHLSVLIRDDGSTDNTISILKRYQERQNVKVIFAENVGVINSFFELIKQADLENDYFAFCDQDDYWEKNKLSNAVKKIKMIPDAGRAILYCSAVELVDDNLNSIEISYFPDAKPSFNNALVENIVTGCTAVLNTNSLRLIKNNIPDFCLMHDWWMYLVISSFGTIIYDTESGIKYRQHANNVVGIKGNRFSRQYDKVKRFFKRKDRNLLIKQAYEFDRLFYKGNKKIQNAELSAFINHRNSIGNAMKYSKNMKVYRQNLVDNIFLKILVFLKLI